jgi:hypothetical protein
MGDFWNLFVPQRLNRLQVGSPVGRVNAKEKPHSSRENCSQKDDI